MNTSEYISSGILENYVLGLTSESETLEVARMAELHLEIREEITAIQNSLELFANKNKVAPPAALKQKIWKKIQESEKVNSGKIVKDKIIPPVMKTEAKVIPMLSRSSYIKYAVAASLLFVIGSAALNIILYIKLTEIHHQLSLLESEKNTFAQQLQTQQTSYHQIENDLAFLSLPTTKKVILNGVPKFPDAMATVYFNSATGEVYLKVKNLPVPTIDKQYQLWAIVDGKPVDAGVFDVNSGLNKMKDFETAQAFAVTLEKKGGSVSPTMDAMYVIGNI